MGESDSIPEKFENKKQLENIVGKVESYKTDTFQIFEGEIHSELSFGQTGEVYKSKFHGLFFKPHGDKNFYKVFEEEVYFPKY